MISASISASLYLVSAILFIFAIRGLSSPATARRGNLLGMLGMALAIGTTFAIIGPAFEPATIGLIAGGLILGGGVGALLAQRAPMTAMPQLVGAFNALGGGASLLVALAAVFAPDSFGIWQFFCTNPAGPNLDQCYGMSGRSVIELSLSILLGALTVTGSLIAFLKLNGNISGGPILLPLRHVLNIILAIAIVGLMFLALDARGTEAWIFLAIAGIALLLGITLIIPIGGADMPVVISMLNSYSGWAAAALGFGLGNFALIIVGALVGSSGAILSYIMCKGMNRSFLSVILGGFGAGDGDGGLYHEKCL